MDDRELEARLRARLHARFDGGQPSAVLRASVEAVPRPAPTFRPTWPRPWLAIAAVMVVAVVVGLNWRIVGPGSTPSPTPDASLAVRTYRLSTTTGDLPSKAATTAATEALAIRLRTVGVGNFSAYGDLVFDLPGDVDDALVRLLLAANGDVSVVPLPIEDYGEGRAVAVVGEPLPVDEPELFGVGDITGGGVATEGGAPAIVHFSLRPPAAAAFDTYTSQNVGRAFGVLVDSRVVALPVVMEPIHDGRVEIRRGGDERRFLLLAAVVASGPLPFEWRDPVVELLEAASATP